VHELFEAQAERTPDAIAVSYEGRQLSYGELNARANRLAHYLRETGVGPDSRVALCLEKNPEMVVGFLAVLKASGADVPIDSQYPDARIRHIVEDAKIRTFLTQKTLLTRLSAIKTGLQFHVLEPDDFPEQPVENPSAISSADNLAYVIYTSGSTGGPKGVAVTHSAIIRLVKNTNYVSILASDNLAQISSPSFHAATFEIWAALLNGARTTVIAKSDTLVPSDFARHLERLSITTLFVTTALFNQYVRETPGFLHTLRYVLFGGEAVDPTAARKALEQ